jgi:hypothetical protein
MYLVMSGKPIRYYGMEREDSECRLAPFSVIPVSLFVRMATMIGMINRYLLWFVWMIVLILWGVCAKIIYNGKIHLRCEIYRICILLYTLKF